MILILKKICDINFRFEEKVHINFHYLSPKVHDDLHPDQLRPASIARGN
jgi:hypothetical protein